MSYDLWISRFEDGEVVPFPRQWVLDEFGPYVLEAGEGFLNLRFPGGGEPCLYLGDGAEVDSLRINWPYGSPELESGILRLLRRSTMVIYGPDTPIVVGRGDTRSHLPGDMVETLGEPIVVGEGSSVLGVLFS